MAKNASGSLMLEEWHGRARPELVLTQSGGMLIYLAGVAMFKRGSSERGLFPLSHIAGLVFIAALAVTAGLPDDDPAALSAIGADPGHCRAWERGSFHGGWGRRLAQTGLTVTADETERVEAP